MKDELVRIAEKTHNKIAVREILNKDNNIKVMVRLGKELLII